jgi:uncharacterized membrane protein YedE/YeeE
MNSMGSFTPISATIGGVLIGVASASLLLFNGRIAGVSGIFARALDPDEMARGFRFAFLGGLIAGGALLRLLAPSAFEGATTTPLVTAILAGLLVGFGTRLANGCTSGHGISGLARFSTRSLVATVVFMATGAGAVLLVRHVAGTP